MNIPLRKSTTRLWTPRNLPRTSIALPSEGDSKKPNLPHFLENTICTGDEHRPAIDDIETSEPASEPASEPSVQQRLMPAEARNRPNAKPAKFMDPFPSAHHFLAKLNALHFSPSTPDVRQIMSRIFSLLLCLIAVPATADDQWLEFPGGKGSGADKHIVLVSGDEEYRSEEALPQLAKILSQHHGFKCTVLFAIDAETGVINPEESSNIPGIESLDSADLLIIATRFRALPDDQMKHVVDYVEAGKPVIGLRTATHAFNFGKDSKSSYKHYGWNYKGDDFNQGFGRQVLGETWISHHGKHKSESTRGIIEDPSHPIATGIEDGDIWCPSDVYGVRLPLPGDSHPIVLGQILSGMTPEDAAVEDKRNDPMMPIAWTRTFKGGRIFTTTMGAATDIENEPLRRLIVNATLWCLSLEDKITPDLNVSIVGDYKPTAFGFGTYVKGKKPADYR